MQDLPQYDPSLDNELATPISTPAPPVAEGASFLSGDSPAELRHLYPRGSKVIVSLSSETYRSGPPRDHLMYVWGVRENGRLLVLCPFDSADPRRPSRVRPSLDPV